MVPSSLHAGDDWTSLEGGGPAYPHLQILWGFPWRGGSGLGWGEELRFLPTAFHPHPPHPVSLLDRAVWRVGEREGATGGWGSLLPLGAPLAGPTRGSSRSTLTFRQPWSSSAAPWLSWPAFLQMDGRDWLQGLSFQRPS